jgi:hypothetical protein
MIAYPIPGTFLRGAVDKDYVTIEGPSAKVLMLKRDAHALMHWLYDALPASAHPAPRGRTERQKDVQRRMSSYSALWIRRRARA